MKKNLHYIIQFSCLVIISLVFIGCVTVEQTIYLGDAEVKAPIDE